MTAIIIPRRHYTQPQGRVTVAPGWADAAFVLPYSTAKNSPVVSTPGGFALDFHNNTASGGRYAVSDTTVVADAGVDGLSVVFVGSFLSSASYNYQYALGVGLGIDIRSNEIYLSTTGTIGGWSYNVPKTHGTCVFVYNGLMGASSAFSVFRDGTKTALSRFQAPSGAVARGDGSVLAGNSQALNRQWAGRIELFAVIPRTITDDQAVEFSSNPYHLFRADPIRIYSLPSGPISLAINSITASNITSSGARITLGLTR